MDYSITCSLNRICNMETYKRLSAEVIAHLFSRIIYQKNICVLY